jgi:hypothetical protein
VGQRNGTVGFEVPTEVTTRVVRKTPTFRRNISPPSSGLMIKPNKKSSMNIQQAVSLAACFFLVSSLTYSYILKREAANSTESLVPISQTAKSYNPEIYAPRKCTVLENLIRGTESF